MTDDEEIDEEEHDQEAGDDVSGSVVEDEPTDDTADADTEADNTADGDTNGDPGADDTSDADTDAEDATDGNRRRLLIVAASVIALVVVVVAVILITRKDPQTPPPPPGSTTTVERTTTTLAELPANTVEVATVRADLETIRVFSVEPDDWASSDPATVSEVEMELPPSSHDSAPERPPIPGAKEPVVGRYVVDDGWEFSNPGPLDPPQPMTFLVTERRGTWAQVMIPVRPNGTVGYVSTDDVEITRTSTRIEIHLADHRLIGYDGDDVLVDSPVVAGVNFSPTPTGLFYLTDIVPQKNPDGFYGPFVLATNGYSEMLNEFDNGVPVIAVHGTNNPALLGQDKSNGCIRVPNDVITQLADEMPAGTPILIWP